MIRYIETDIVFWAVPDEVTLAINITNCPCNCKGCHSSYLSEDIGEVLTPLELHKLIVQSEGITCVAFMGGDIDPTAINRLAHYIKDEYKSKYKVAWYSGKDAVAAEVDFDNFDYIKIGHYDEKRGGLDSSTTNQIFMQIIKRKDKEFTVKMLNKRFLK